MPKEDLKYQKISKLFWKYAIPAIISNSATSIYNIIDRIFIGNGVGPYAISGLALTLPLSNIAIALSTLVGVGASAILSIRLGEGKKEIATQTMGNAVILFLLIGGLFSVTALIFIDPILILFGASEVTLPYARDFMQIILAGNIIGNMFFGLYNIMRASGYPTKGMITITMTIVLNLILAPLFIFVFKWGIRGAALATVISQTCGLIFVLTHFFNKKSLIHFTKGCFKLSIRIIGRIFSIGLSPFAVHIGSFIVLTIINRQLLKYGGDLAVGAGGIINTLGGLISMLILGVSQGMQPIVGYNFGAKQYDRMWKTYQLSCIVGTAITVTLWAVNMLFPAAIASIFTQDETLIAIIADGMVKYMLLFPLIPIQMITSQFYLSIGKSAIAIILSLLRQLLILLPLLLILPPKMGIDGVWYAEPIACFLATMITILVLIQFIKRFNINIINNNN